MNGNFTNFRAVYDDLTDEVSRSQHQFISDHLRNWFETIDNTPELRGIVAGLEQGINFKEWWAATNSAYQRTGGNAGLNFSPERRQALGMKLQLFRAMVRGEITAAEVGYRFANTGTQNINANGRALIQPVFMPMARELRSRDPC